MKKIKYTLFILFLFVSSFSFGQFYNGHQMNFGKNRVQYNDWFWQFFRYDRFDTYFYANGKDLALYTAKIIEKKIIEIEQYFGYNLEKRIIFLIYNRLSDFRQSNIGLVSGDNETNTGGIYQILDNKVFLYFEGDHRKYEKQITAMITEMVLSEMLFGQNFREKITNNALMTMPDWFYYGLISYISNNWDFEIENIVKDGIINNRFKRFNQLYGDEAKYAGHSIWKFIADNFGKDAIQNILYMTRINKSVNNGITYVLGMSIKEITPLWLDYFKKKFSKTESSSELPDSLRLFKRPKKNTVYLQIKMSPNKKHIAYATNELGKYKIFIYDTETRKNKKLIRKEHSIEQITDYSYPILAWHPSGKILSYIVEEEGYNYIYSYNLETAKTRKQMILYFDKILDASYSDDGFNMAVSAIINGMTDIFLYNVAAGTNYRITQDLADDFNPRFIDKSTKIIFSSTRLSDTITFEKKVHYPVGRTTDLFIYDLKSKSKILTRVSSSPYVNETFPYQIKQNNYAFLSDQNGILNRHLASYDSTISFIDTTTHYRYFTNQFPITNYSRNITSFDLSIRNKKQTDVVFSNNKYYIYYNQLITNKNSFSSKYQITDFRNEETKAIIKKDSLAKIKAIKEQREIKRLDSLKANLPKNQILSDTTKIDFNNYVFEKEKGIVYDLIMKQDSNKTQKDTLKEPEQRIYFKTFYINQVVGQVDFQQLNMSYQAFNGGPYYFNPGFNVFFKIGINDLFEDYKLVGGFRVGGDFDSFEYLLSLENLKHRLDKQYIYHRTSNSSSFENIYYKVITNELMYILRYPFSQVTALKTTLSLRSDQLIFLSTDRITLRAPDYYQTFSSAKTEYIFDNTVSLGLNLYSGSRYKIFGEFYQQLDDKYTNMFVVGADFRYYERIHRNMIFAARFAASSSFGLSRLIYYLGGVDNWTPLSDANMFDRSVSLDSTKNYIYQAVATNMRGFIQNCRNGESFALINTEIRWPIFRYFSNSPISSDFINNFQIVGFFDAGMAWSGLNPLLDKNSWNRKVIMNNPLKITVDTNRVPIVAGYGFGLRTKLLGYFMRFDWAWGVDGGVILPQVFYFSLSLDF